MVDVFPSILPDGDDFTDNAYLRAELEKKPYSELQSIAAEHESDNVHGRMSQQELIENLAGLERL